MDGEGSKGTKLYFERLDEDYRSWSTYCKAYLRDNGNWAAVVTPRPVLVPSPEVVIPPAGDVAGTSASHAAAMQAREARDKNLMALEEWDRKDEKALAQIQMAVKPHLLNLVADCKSAAEAWDCLRVLFEDNTMSRRAELEEELTMLRMLPSETIIKYVGRAKGLRNDLATAGVTKDDQTLTLHILRGLPAGYSTIRTVLRNTDAPLRLPAVTAKLLSVEKELQTQTEGEVPPGVQAYLAAMSIKRDDKRTRTDKKPLCFYCKKPGHKIADCNKRRAADDKRGGGRGGKGPFGGDKGDDKKLAFCARLEVGAASRANDVARGESWLVDSGATHHLATGRGTFKVGHGVGGEQVTLASGGTLATTGRGVATLNVEAKGISTAITLQDAHRVPGLRENLLSVGRVDKAGGAVLFALGHCYIYGDADVVAPTEVVSKADAVGELDADGQYMIGGFPVVKQAMMASAPVTGAATVWHRRFFHLGYTNLQRAARMVKGLPTEEVAPERVAGAVCRPCIEGKMSRAPFPESNTKTDVMELLHVDITGPFPASVGGSRYLIVLYEDAAGVTMGVPIRAKGDAGQVLKAKIPELERRSGKKLKRIRFDGAKEFITGNLKSWYGNKGIDVEITPPYSPQSNGKAERVNRTIKERVRAALVESGLGQELWAEAAVAATYVMNRSPKEGLDVTPWEAFTGERPDVSGLAVWGSTAFALKPPKNIIGMESRTSVGKMVGYAPGGRAYRVLLDGSKAVVVRRDVAFDEATISAHKEIHWGGVPDVQAVQANGSLPRGTPTGTPRGTPAATPSSPSSGSSGRTQAPITPDVQAAIDAAKLLTGALAEGDDGPPENNEVQRYPNRMRQAPSRYGQDGSGVAASAAMIEDTIPAKKPVMVRDLPPPPKSVREAKARDDWPLWEAALRDERQSMVNHRVWEKKKAPPGARRLGTHVLFEYKSNQAGELERPKCRLVGQGNRQKPGKDYRESWAAMPAAATTRAFLGTAAARGWAVHHLDVKTAYLYAPMDVDVYITIPDGFEDAGEDALLRMAMYGTKQAGHLWGKHLDGKLVEEGGVQSQADKCVYTFNEDDAVVRVEVHVDDILVGGPSDDAVKDVKRRISRHFEVRDLGEVKSYLGMQVLWDRNAGTVALSNPRHIADLLKEFNMEESKANHTPMAQGTELGGGEPLPDGNRYAELVGSLMYLANQTRPDIAYAVGKLARRMSCPTEADWRAAKGCLRYLQGTRGMGIVYGKVAPMEGWVDSDFAGDKDTRKSTTGFVFTLHGGAISWRSRMQRLVATSTAAAEYVAAAEAVKDSLWLRRVMGDLGEYAGPVTLKEDNQACIAMATNEGMSSRTKHIDVCYHLIRDCVAQQQVVVEYVPSEQQLADGFTKPLPRPAFDAFRTKLGVVAVGRQGL